MDDAFNIHEDPVELIDVPKTDSNTLTTLIKDSLLRFSLPLSQCRGQAYDGASNMSGHISGVAAQIKEIKPTAIYVHCLAHSTNLSSNSRKEDFSYPRGFRPCNGAKSIYTIFSKTIYTVSKPTVPAYPWSPFSKTIVSNLLDCVHQSN